MLYLRFPSYFMRMLSNFDFFDTSILPTKLCFIRKTFTSCFQISDFPFRYESTTGRRMHYVLSAARRLRCLGQYIIHKTTCSRDFPLFIITTINIYLSMPTTSDQHMCCYTRIYTHIRIL